MARVKYKYVQTREREYEANSTPSLLPRSSSQPSRLSIFLFFLSLSLPPSLSLRRLKYIFIKFLLAYEIARFLSVFLM